ncbi:MAG TPA: c-type cytochrome [Polyangiaceae bacterium]|nr:c-type cytochrome [Polyangiaceae bacterium]
MKNAALLARILLIVTGTTLTACKREARRFIGDAHAAALPSSLRMGELVAGGPSPPAPPRREEDNAYDVNQGQQLFERFNCAGCHGHGGGGMGSALMDSKWIYGSAPDNVFATIVEGRPNGMPSFGGKIPVQQVRQLVAYVRSLGGLARFDVAPSRPDSMQLATPPSMSAADHPTEQAAEHP